jgi:hypothetical protein
MTPYPLQQYVQAREVEIGGGHVGTI